MLDQIFPATVKSMYVRHDQLSGELYPEEADLIRQAHPKRQREFTAGRLAARQLLSEFDVSAFPLLRDQRRAPVWPAGLCGSISHSHVMCAAAVASRSDHSSIGLDIEQLVPISDGAMARIATAAELASLQSLSPEDQRLHRMLIFSAKECGYKSQYPLTGEWINFHDATVDIDITSNTFTITFVRAIGSAIAQGSRLLGRFAIDSNYVLTGIHLPADFKFQ